MKVSYTTLFVEGNMEPALSVEVNSIKDLRLFSDIHTPGFEGFFYIKGRVRGKALETVDQEPNILKSFASTYNHYVKDIKGVQVGGETLNPEVKSIDNPFLTRYNYELSSKLNCESTNPSYDYVDMVKNLVKDCSSRMPFEFDKTGRDIGWFLLGERILLLRGGESEGILDKVKNYKGFLSYTMQDDRSVKIWMAYTKEKYRGEKVFSTLLKYLENICLSIGCPKLYIATDTSYRNNMNDILAHKGFTVESRTYRSGVDLKKIENQKMYELL